MAGIYIHIPFCKQKCHYCDFHFAVSMKNKAAILDSLKREFILRKKFFYKNDDPIETVYFGGGTPSVLTSDEIKDLLDEMAKSYNLNSLKEITLECNPDDLNIEKIKALKETAINRLSIGIQSFRDEDLKGLNRAHNSIEATQSVIWAQEFGFENITIDLIYGLPNMDMAAWEYNLEKAKQLNIQHLSCYALTIEKRTALHHFIERGIVTPADEESTIRQFESLISWAEEEEMDHYEISNFAKKGHLALHNTNYWKDKSYIGFGPSAHSYDGRIRSWNVANNTKYIQSIKKGKVPLMDEILSSEDRYNEYMLTGLRTKWGIERDRLEKFGNIAKTQFQNNIQTYIESGHVIVTKAGWALSKSGKFIADRISSDLFMTD